MTENLAALTVSACVTIWVLVFFVRLITHGEDEITGVKSAAFSAVGLLATVVFGICIAPIIFLVTLRITLAVF